MKKFLSLLLTVIMVVGLCAGCGDKQDETTAASGESPAASGAVTTTEAVNPNKEPSRTDLNMVLAAQGTTLDPQKSGQIYDIQVEKQIYDPLVYCDEQINTEGRVAESWEVSPDGLTWTFKIRKGIKFHNGDPLTIEDVVFTYERALGEAQMLNYVSTIESVEAQGDDTLILHMNSPHNAFLMYQSMIGILNKSQVEALGDSFGSTNEDAGCGPYQLVSYDISSKIVLKAFEDYYLAPATIKDVTYYVITQAASAVVALQTGQVDFYAVPTSSWEEIKASGQFTCVEYAANSARYLCMNPANPDNPLYDKRVRQAIQYALDKQEILEMAVDGFAFTADHMNQVGSFLGAVETSWKYEQNLDKAKQLLAEAGYANGCNIGTIQVATDGFEKAAQDVQAQLKELGITCNIQRGQSATMLPDWRAGKYDMIINGYAPVFTYDFYAKYNNYELATVFVKYDKNPEVDEKYVTETFAKARAEMDTTKANALYKELEEYLMDAAAWMPLWYGMNTFAFDKNLNPIPFSSYYYLYKWSWN